jgi:hypothetical protein
VKPLQDDTPLAIERLWLEALRAKGPLWRLRRTFELTDACFRWGTAAYERTHPEATPAERDEWLLRERYGDDLAQRVMAHCRAIGWHER